jgi:hypothetical protein
MRHKSLFNAVRAVRWRMMTVKRTTIFGMEKHCVRSTCGTLRTFVYSSLTRTRAHAQVAQTAGTMYRTYRMLLDHRYRKGASNGV